MKKLLSVIIFAFCLLFCNISLAGCYGGTLVLDGWKPTMEEAVQAEIDRFPTDFPKEERVACSIAKNCYKKTAYWLFVAENGTIKEYSFAYAEGKGYVYNGGWEYGHITAPFDYLEEFGEDKSIGAYQVVPDSNILRGLRVHDGLAIYVNNQAVNVVTYEVAFKGTTCVIDYWELIGFDKTLDEAKITLQGDSIL